MEDQNITTRSTDIIKDKDNDINIENGKDSAKDEEIIKLFDKLNPDSKEL